MIFARHPEDWRGVEGCARSRKARYRPPAGEAWALAAAVLGDPVGTAL